MVARSLLLLLAVVSSFAFATPKLAIPPDLQVPTPLVKVPKGTYNRIYDAWISSEKRQVPITISKDFYMEEDEVIVAQYAACVTAGKCKAPKQWKQQLKKPKLPVVWVSWYDAHDYCQFIGRRLPTEAEWEKAMFGGYTPGNLEGIAIPFTHNPVGGWDEVLHEAIHGPDKKPPAACNVVNIGEFDGHKCPKRRGPEEVARFCTYNPPILRDGKEYSPYFRFIRMRLDYAMPDKANQDSRIYHPYGNVSEWVQDWTISKLDDNGKGAYYLPVNAIDPSGEPSGDHKVVRGAHFERNSLLSMDDRGTPLPVYQLPHLGMRCAADKVE